MNQSERTDDGLAVHPTTGNPAIGNPTIREQANVPVPQASTDSSLPAPLNLGFLPTDAAMQKDTDQRPSFFGYRNTITNGPVWMKGLCRSVVLSFRSKFKVSASSPSFHDHRHAKTTKPVRVYRWVFGRLSYARRGLAISFWVFLGLMAVSLIVALALTLTGNEAGVFLFIAFGVFFFVFLFISLFIIFGGYRKFDRDVAKNIGADSVQDDLEEAALASANPLFYPPSADRVFWRRRFILSDGFFLDLASPRLTTGRAYMKPKLAEKIANGLVPRADYLNDSLLLGHGRRALTLDRSGDLKSANDTFPTFRGFFLLPQLQGGPDVFDMEYADAVLCTQGGWDYGRNGQFMSESKPLGGADLGRNMILYAMMKHDLLCYSYSAFNGLYLWQQSMSGLAYNKEHIQSVKGDFSRSFGTAVMVVPTGWHVGLRRAVSLIAEQLFPHSRLLNSTTALAIQAQVRLDANIPIGRRFLVMTLGEASIDMALVDVDPLAQGLFAFSGPVVRTVATASVPMGAYHMNKLLFQTFGPQLQPAVYEDVMKSLRSRKRSCLQPSNSDLLMLNLHSYDGIRAFFNAHFLRSPSNCEYHVAYRQVMSVFAKAMADAVGKLLQANGSKVIDQVVYDFEEALFFFQGNTFLANNMSTEQAALAEQVSRIRGFQMNLSDDSIRGAINWALLNCTKQPFGYVSEVLTHNLFARFNMAASYGSTAVPAAAASGNFFPMAKAGTVLPCEMQVVVKLPVTAPVSHFLEVFDGSSEAAPVMQTFCIKPASVNAPFPAELTIRFGLDCSGRLRAYSTAPHVYSIESCW